MAPGFALGGGPPGGPGCIVGVSDEGKVPVTVWRHEVDQRGDVFWLCSQIQYK